MSSPFFTQGRAGAGQLSIPMGTHHVCPACHNSHVCDVQDCSVPLASPCPSCGDTELHSAKRQDPPYLRKLRAQLEHYQNQTDLHSRRLVAELRRQIGLAELTESQITTEQFDALYGDEEPRPKQEALWP